MTLRRRVAVKVQYPRVRETMAADVGRLRESHRSRSFDHADVQAYGNVALPLDRLQELLAWLRDTSDQLAHDFRTPLARAAARLDRLADVADGPGRLRLAAEAREDLRLLTRAMDEAVSLRDGESWVFETVRLDEICAAAAELYQPLAEARDVRIITDLQPTEVLGVRSLLQRAVANLVDNAVKFAPDGSEVAIRAGDDQGRPGFSVADRGPGVDPAVLDGPPRKRGTGDRESHGMGLPFVRAIVHRHGGRLSIANRGPGALISVRF